MTIHVVSQKIPRPHLGGATEWSISGLTDITVLVGRNGSGKSVLLRNWRNLNPDTTHYVVPERTGEMNFQPAYMNDEMGGSARRGYSERNFVDSYRQRVLSRVQAYFMTRGNYRGDGLPPCAPSELEARVSRLLPDFQLELTVGQPPYRLIRNDNGQAITNADHLSSGEAQLLTVSLDILTICAMWELNQVIPRLLLLDEPDAHIHPDMQARFADFIVGLVERFSLQLVVATHSTSLLSALGQFGGEMTSVIFLNRTSAAFQAKRFDHVSKEMASCLGGHLLMGPLFGAPLLLVEGDDDYRIWSQVPRHHVVNLAVMPTNGDEIRRYQLTTERIFASLSDPPVQPLGYALLDGDKALPTPNPQNPQIYIRYLRLSCHEAENLYLTDVVLESMGTTWAAACEKLVNACDQFGENSEFVRNARNWNRREIDLKPVMKHLADLIDDKGVQWMIRVAAAIGKAKPSGELASFLGEPVIAALWPREPQISA
jgi:energy-coupling factor transporter ATP-binding protein EcfA2